MTAGRGTTRSTAAFLELLRDVLAYGDPDEQAIAASILESMDPTSGQTRSIVREPEGFVSLAGIAPDFTEGVDSATYIKERWK